MRIRVSTETDGQTDGQTEREWDVRIRLAKLILHSAIR